MTALGLSICAALEKVIDVRPAVLHEPTFAGSEEAYVLDCLRSTFVSSVGEYVDKFERALEEFTGAKYAVATVNGTSALQLALRVAGVELGQEVLVPSVSFVATANAVANLGAIPHFCASSFPTMGLDPVQLRRHLEKTTTKTSIGLINSQTGRKITCMIPMHTFGHPCNLAELQDIANDFQIVLVEDAAESLGSFYRGKHTGTFGIAGVFSFNGNKTVTTGGGGAIITDCEAVADACRHLSTTAKLDHKWEYNHDMVAYNYRMPNINAALGCAQLEQLEEFVHRKRELYQRYKDAFRDIAEVELVEEPNQCHSNYWLQTIVLSPSVRLEKDGILEILHENGILARPLWKPLHTLQPFSHCPSAPQHSSLEIYERVINIPSSASLL